MFCRLLPLTWKDFDKAIKLIAEQVDTDKIKAIYGEPRGGLCLAVALSHQLDIPLVNHSGDHVLWIDDIIETRRTLDRNSHKFGQCAAWLVRSPQHDCIHAFEVGDGWIVFPWENLSKAEKDMKEYALSRQ